MKEFEAVLRIGSSALAGATRGALTGLALSLRGVRRFGPPGDPAGEAADRLLEAIETLLEAFLDTPDAPQEPLALVSVPAMAPPRNDLVALRERFLTAPEVRTELPGFMPPSSPPPAVWMALNLALLRLSPGHAERWRKQILAEAGGRAAEAHWVDLPWHEDVLLVPGWADDPEAPGLRLSPNATIDPRLGDPPAEGTVALAMSRVVSVALWFAEHDRTLFHGLEDLYPFGLVPLEDLGHRSAYQDELVNRYVRFAQKERAGDAAQALKDWVRLDEAVHSLVHTPVPPARSWMVELSRHGRESLHQARSRTSAEGHKVTIRELSGEYASALGFLGKRDLSSTGTEPPGHILRCLRLYLKIDGEEERGRVLYRPY